ncbi:acetylxylan esterase [Agromyces sp. SYSU T00194]|uniref:acetylxylan esterase n=1 Tax=Agromyces chitinivorans TaxID=3158560 RepID=UPI00339B12D8
MHLDLPELELRDYRSSQIDPDDFDAFWSDTIAESRAAGGTVELEPVDTGLRLVDVFDVTFPGFGGERVKAWLRLPHDRPGPLPAVVEFVGYGGGRGRPTEGLLWAAAGFAHLHMDTRGQGAAWSPGATPDSGTAGPQVPGFLTRGIESPETFYYRRVYTDAVRAIDAARAIEAIDPHRIAAFGGSQGGGITLAAAALSDGLVAAVPLVPFLCDFPRALTIHDTDPYHEVVRYLRTHRDRVEATLRTLAYFDGVNFARRATVPAWFSAALMDATCKPSTVFGAFNAYAGPKEIDVWPFNGHEGGGPDSTARAVRRLHEVFATDARAGASAA